MLAGGLVLLAGCASSIRLASVPSGAHLEFADGRVLTAPTVVPFRPSPGKPQPVRVTLEGYRPLTIDLQRTQGRMLSWIEGLTLPRTGREITIVLVPEAAPVDAPL